MINRILSRLSLWMAYRVLGLIFIGSLTGCIGSMNYTGQTLLPEQHEWVMSVDRLVEYDLEDYPGPRYNIYPGLGYRLGLAGGFEIGLIDRAIVNPEISLRYQLPQQWTGYFDASLNLHVGGAFGNQYESLLKNLSYIRPGITVSHAFTKFEPYFGIARINTIATRKTYSNPLDLLVFTIGAKIPTAVESWFPELNIYTYPNAPDKPVLVFGMGMTF
ncbi:MAG: hypothetical protein K9N22_09575 [Candidatus Marinimicrobia bacterium]|nr:hypothetical protein [Candidatus Neomarinimicrobiota bacterium]MCF7903360.1 hypothetical protein [Candidatus Neomarinimicrobiota bacterium]